MSSFSYVSTDELQIHSLFNLLRLLQSLKVSRIDIEIHEFLMPNTSRHMYEILLKR